jgi:hypothetical protein
MQTVTWHQDFDECTETTAATTAAIMDILVGSKRSSTLLARDGRAARIERFVRSGALIDAALALIAFELPQWQLRRVAYDSGEWHCALSRTRELADWLDQSAEGRHADLALALLDALVEAQHIAAPPRQPGVQPSLVNATDVLMCCDHFS